MTVATVMDAMTVEVALRPDGSRVMWFDGHRVMSQAWWSGGVSMRGCAWIELRPGGSDIGRVREVYFILLASDVPKARIRIARSTVSADELAVSLPIARAVKLEQLARCAPPAGLTKFLRERREERRRTS